MYGHAPVAALRSNSLREGCYAECVATPPPREEGCHADRVATPPPREGCSLCCVELVAAFKGIPYASPPVGHRRFAAPEPYARRYAAGTGRRLGAACPQTAWLSYYAPEDYSEDCLFLNVYTPLSRLESSHGSNSSATASRGGSVGGGAPVLVFLHGGSFLWGS